MPANIRGALLFLFPTLFLLLSGCMHLHNVQPGHRPVLYQPPEEASTLAAKYAPAFLINNPHQTHNHNGQPVARLDSQANERVTVDPGKPGIYYQILEFKTDKDSYTNLIYRIHFPATPLSLVPFFIGAGENMGLLVVVTLDKKKRPVLVTTTGTCGCYTAMVPTDYLLPTSLPETWTGKTLEIYGERLPALLPYSRMNNPRLMVEIRPGEHRVMDLKVLPKENLADAARFEILSAPLIPAQELRKLPVQGGPEGMTTSLFHEGGPLQGHVKGAWKPWETLILGLVSFDLLVGSDKAYGDKANPFYTSLKFWARQDSDMNDFPRFLRYWDWRL